MEEKKGSLRDKFKAAGLRAFWGKHKKLAIGALAAAFLSLVIALAVIFGQGEEEIVYRETEVEYGELSVGITESSSIDVGSVTQSFTLDISSLIKEEDSSSSGDSQMGGMQAAQAVISQMMGGGGVSYSSEAADVTVEEVKVSVGQLVSQGDILFTLTQDSVEAIRTQLQEDYTEAETAVNTIESSQKSDRLEAQQSYDSSLLYGKYAQVEYDEAVEEAEEEVEEKTESLELLTEELALYQEEYDEAMENYLTALSYYTNIEDTLEDMDKTSDPSWYLSLDSTRKTAKSTVESLEEELETLEESIGQGDEELAALQDELEAAQRSLELTRLSAQQTYDLRMLAMNTAQESYDISIGYLDEEAGEEQKAYASASEKLEEFDSAIIDYGIYSEYEGVLTEISVAAGDAVTTDTALITLYNSEDITMSVSLEESDVEKIGEGNVVNISLTAYPDTVYRGTVSEIGDAQYDSSTATSYYEVTVNVEGEMTDFYQGMTGELTFVTKETQEVIYVSNRAITRTGTKSSVKMKDEEGNIMEKEVVTGFSDGENVEIKEGLSEGDIVLIESKVSDE